MINEAIPYGEFIAKHFPRKVNKAWSGRLRGEKYTNINDKY